MDEEQRATIRQFQNKQWKSLYDAKHDKERIQLQHLQRLAKAGKNKIAKYN